MAPELIHPDPSLLLGSRHMVDISTRMMIQTLILGFLSILILM